MLFDYFPDALSELTGESKGSSTLRLLGLLLQGVEPTEAEAITAAAWAATTIAVDTAETTEETVAGITNEIILVSPTRHLPTHRHNQQVGHLLINLQRTLL